MHSPAKAAPFLNEVFRCRDDYELGLQLLATGAVVAYAPDALALNHETVDVGRSFSHAWAEGQADVWIGQRHPEILSMLSLARARAPPGGACGTSAPRRLPTRAPRPSDARGLLAEEMEQGLIEALALDAASGSPR